MQVDVTIEEEIKPHSFEMNHYFYLPNRPLAHLFHLSLLTFPYFVKLPFISTLMKKLIQNGNGPDLSNNKVYIYIKNKALINIF